MISIKISINRERETTTLSAHANLMKILYILLSLLLKRIEDENQLSNDHMNSARG